FEVVPFVVGEKQGFYAKQHLKVSVILPPDTSTTVKMVARGEADIGFDTTADVAFARAANIPITSIGNYSMQNNWGLFTNPGQPVNIHQLKGKSIGVFTDAWTKSMMPFVLRAGHVTPSQVKQIIFTSNDLAPLLAHKIDIATNTSNYALAGIKSSSGKNPEVALGTKFGAPNVPIWDYTAMSSWLQSHATEAREFLTATAEATRWAISHPTQAVNEFVAAYPRNGESVKYNLIGWKATIPFLRNTQGQLLTQTSQEWTQITGALKSAGQISTTFPPSKYYTNAYLPK
ncbi:MAG TPA: ABC transporter substrate-binding protein, partial [Solirubrobacteraceae bacterium]|nr:ABC transporter substrate-binding protein [Solirubrobacteraceae bacterium]